MARQRKVVALAGASRGLGLTLAREFASRGYRLAICSRSAGSLKTAAADLSEYGVEIHTHPCDITDRQAVQQWIKTVEDDFGPIHTLVVVAGIIQVGPPEDMTIEHFDKALAVMTHGPIYCVMSALEYMRERNTGHIGIVTSIGGMVSAPHMWPYATAKFGAVGFSDGLAAAVAGTGITATTLVPGLMRTGSHEHATFVGDGVKESAWFSLSATLPLLSINGERAAKKMVDGVLRGKPMTVITPAAWMAIRARGLMPGTITRLMGIANRLLPGPTGQTEARPGYLFSDQWPQWVKRVTVLGERAAARNNESRPD